MSIPATHQAAERDVRAITDAQRLAHDVLAPAANANDQESRWPQDAIAAIAQAGLLGIAIPAEYGGLALSYLAQARVFMALAAGDVTAAFIASQHHACTTLVTASPQQQLRDRWLPGLATGALHGANGFNFLNFPPDRAPMKAHPVADGYIFDGALPWVTAAHHSDLLVGGAVLPDGLQILAAIPLHEDLLAQPDAISVDAPMDLMALAGSDTTVVRCHEYFIPATNVLLGPGPNLLKSTFRGGTPYVPTAMTLGHDKACLRLIDEIAARKNGSNTTMGDWLRGEIRELEFATLAALAAEDFEQAPQLRGRGNALAVRAAHLALIAGGGTGFRDDQTPQRLYREAGFFSVWSVSGQIIPETLRHLLT